LTQLLLLLPLLLLLLLQHNKMVSLRTAMVRTCLHLGRQA
jgi:hypothetical protein